MEAQDVKEEHRREDPVDHQAEIPSICCASTRTGAASCAPEGRHAHSARSAGESSELWAGQKAMRHRMGSGGQPEDLAFKRASCRASTNYLSTMDPDARHGYTRPPPGIGPLPTALPAPAHCSPVESPRPRSARAAAFSDFTVDTALYPILKPMPAAVGAVGPIGPVVIRAFIVPLISNRCSRIPHLGGIDCGRLRVQRTCPGQGKRGPLRAGSVVARDQMDALTNFRRARAQLPEAFALTPSSCSLPPGGCC